MNTGGESEAMSNTIKMAVLDKVKVTYALHTDGSVSVESVVTQGNFVENYNGRLSFCSVEEMIEWARKQYN